MDNILTHKRTQQWSYNQPSWRNKQSHNQSDDGPILGTYSSASLFGSPDRQEIVTYDGSNHQDDGYDPGLTAKLCWCHKLNDEHRYE